MNNDRLHDALAELRRERQRGARLRDDYRAIVGSRFYALRMLWQSARSMFGGRSALRSFVAWNAGMLAPPSRGVAHDAVIDADAILERWRERARMQPAAAEPLVTLVIPVFNHRDATLRCLDSVARTWPASFAVECIVGDDASTDDTQALLHDVPGIVYVRAERNVGFVRNVNAAAQHARGRYVCLLNNDTIVHDGWLDHLVSTLERDASVGAAGAKLVYPDGRLQEAGGIIWSDASGWNYGRGDDPNDARYNYKRNVDYCSGAALLVRRDLFERLGGLSLDFAPAYYEDVDLCFAIRNAGYLVVYQPRAVVTHVEGVSSGTDLDHGVKRHQALNQPKFREKWSADLRAHLPPHPENVEAAARRLVPLPRVLVVDSYVPMHDREAGSSRLMRIVRYLRAKRYGVVFLPDNYAPLQPYTDELEALGVEVLYHSERGRSLDDALAAALTMVDYAWICRPELFEKYAPTVRRAPGVRLVYDTIDLHFVRKRREATLLGGDMAEAERYESRELAAARYADATVVVSPEERAVLAERGIERLFVVPTVHDREVDTRSYDESSGLLFIGNYQHAPNVDAAKWLVSQIMPRVWERLPHVTLTLVGSNPSDEILNLAQPRVSVPGYVPDVRPLFERARIFVAPLRFGAGIKGKVGQAMAYGLPVVATPVAAEGFDLDDGVHGFIAQEADAFADAVVRAYGDRETWQRMSRAVLQSVERFSSDAVGASVLALLRSL